MSKYCRSCGQEILQELSDEKREFLENLRGVQRIVINKQHGGFSLSKQAVREYLEMTNTPYEFREQPDRDSQNRFGSDIYVGGKYFNDREIPRDDPALVAVVKKLGDSADGDYASLRIVTIPGDVEWQIEEYDGLEWIAEVHRTWQ